MADILDSITFGEQIAAEADTGTGAVAGISPLSDTAGSESNKDMRSMNNVDDLFSVKVSHINTYTVKIPRNGYEK